EHDDQVVRRGDQDHPGRREERERGELAAVGHGITRDVVRVQDHAERRRDEQDHARDDGEPVDRHGVPQDVRGTAPVPQRDRRDAGGNETDERDREVHAGRGPPGERLVEHPDDRERAQEQLREDRTELDRRRRDHGCALAATCCAGTPTSSHDPAGAGWTWATAAHADGSIDRVKSLGYTPNTSSSVRTGTSTATSRPDRSGRWRCSSRTGPYATRWYDHSR